MATVTGTSGNDRYPNEVKGTEAADQLFGLAGDDTLIAFGGNDVLEGGKGADELFGSTGFDYASYKGSASGVYVNLGSFAAALGDAAGDVLYSIEGLTGSGFGDTLYGDDGRNVLRGEGGIDQLDGLAGNDTLLGGGGNDYLEGGTGDDDVRGGDGNDTAVFHNFQDVSDTGVVVNLSDGTARGSDYLGTDRLSGIENVVGSASNDQIIGNAGVNQLQGAWGADVLVGGGGADRFVYYSVDDSYAELVDLIRDFSRSQGDKISLNIIDANEQVDGNQAFQFIGQKQFTGAGQLRFFQENGDTVVEANITDATAGAELRIEIDPLVNFQATDFVL